MLFRLDLGATRRRRRGTAGPLDVLNLIHFSDEGWYQWYSLFVAPALWAVGGKVRWGGRHAGALLGEPLAEKLLVVRYPASRNFKRMTLNPYYLAINQFREWGVRRFEASFTQAVREAADFSHAPWLVGVHYNVADPESIDAGGPALGIVEDLLARGGGTLAYATSEVGPLAVYKELRPTDPNPLALRHFVAIAFPDEETARAAVSSEVLAAITSATTERAVHLYERVNLRTMLPPFIANRSA